MSFERLRTQVQFENIISNNDNTVWQSLTKAQIKAFAFTAAHVSILENALLQDSIDFYYKGLLSFYESLLSAQIQNYSWATVKSYYSTFYFLRSSLCCQNIGFVRKARDAYYFENKLAKTPIKLSSPDHKAAIEIFTQFYAGTDFLQSNKIDGINPYEWLRNQRENINYKFRTFYEPDAPLIWETIATNIQAEGMEYWIKKYIDDDIYAFLEEHSVIALPLRRLILTHTDLVNQNIRTIVKADKEFKLIALAKMSKCLEFLKPYNRGKS